MADTGARILLVDDEEAILKLLRFPLEKEGYQVVTARDGEEALETFARESFDLVILDLMLPHVDGMEVCRRIRAQSIVPIIMLTAKSEEFDKVLGLEIGADDYITKDKFSLREFRSRVRAQLRRAEMSRSAEATKKEVIKVDDLDLRPIHHWLEDRVKAHVLLCMLAQYLVWHLRQALAPLTYTDEQPPTRDNPVAPAQRSAAAARKASRHVNEHDQPLYSFRGLLTHLATLTRNDIRYSRDDNIPAVPTLTASTPTQRRAFELLATTVPLTLT